MVDGKEEVLEDIFDTREECVIWYVKASAGIPLEKPLTQEELAIVKLLFKATNTTRIRLRTAFQEWLLAYNKWQSGALAYRWEQVVGKDWVPERYRRYSKTRKEREFKGILATLLEG